MKPLTGSEAQAARVGAASAGVREALGALFLALAVPAVVYLAFYAPIPAVHDTLHNLRHSFFGLPCH